MIKLKVLRWVDYSGLSEETNNAITNIPIRER